MAARRSATEVVDQAIRENWPSERLCYIFASILVGVGSLAIVAGVVAVFAGKDLGADCPPSLGRFPIRFSTQPFDRHARFGKRIYA